MRPPITIIATHLGHISRLNISSRSIPPANILLSSSLPTSIPRTSDGAAGDGGSGDPAAVEVARAGGHGGSRRWWRWEAMATTGRQLLASPPLLPPSRSSRRGGAARSAQRAAAEVMTTTTTAVTTTTTLPAVLGDLDHAQQLPSLYLSLLEEASSGGSQLKMARGGGFGDGWPEVAALAAARPRWLRRLGFSCVFLLVLVCKDVCLLNLCVVNPFCG